jgi:hypothetical protein
LKFTPTDATQTQTYSAEGLIGTEVVAITSDTFAYSNVHLSYTLFNNKENAKCGSLYIKLKYDKINAEKKTISSQADLSLYATRQSAY